MTKGSKKISGKDLYSDIVSLLADKYKVTERFARMAVLGERTSARADEIKKEYYRHHRRIKRSYSEVNKEIGLRPTQ